MKVAEPESTVQSGWAKAVLVGRDPERTAIRIVVLVALVFLFVKFIFVPIRVQGVSMLPTYSEDGVNFVNRIAYALHSPRRYDVVAIRTTGMSIMYMKRIIALPGEEIEFRGGHTFINGRELPEPYLRKPCYWNLPPRILGPDEYYVVGDNRSMAAEDHTKGVAKRDRIVGKVLL